VHDDFAASLFESLALARHCVVDVLGLNAAARKLVVISLLDVDDADLVVFEDEASHGGARLVFDVLLRASQSERVHHGHDDSLTWFSGSREKFVLQTLKAIVLL
jgi:hypothetical protein